MKFYVKGYKEKIKETYEYPCFIIITNTWDDFGFKTTFELQYYNSRENRYIIGSFKVIDLNNDDTNGYSTVLPEVFLKLKDNFGSVGFNIDYYYTLVTIKEKFNIDINKVLINLNDLSTTPGLLGNFENETAYNYSLLRERETKTALLQGSNIINNKPLDKIKFSFSTKFKKAETPYEINVLFERNPIIPKRIYCIIGKNGTGKTQFLANLANSLNYTQVKRTDSPKFNSIKKINLESYEIGKFDTVIGPPFGKIIALSYSMFDNFKRPKSSKKFSYVYCGIRDVNDNIDKELLKTRHIKSLKNINRDPIKIELWIDILKEFIDFDDFGYSINLEFPFNINNIETIENEITMDVSSGHSIIIYSLTQLIDNISTNSLILFDEPENHLHPNAILKLINSLNKILKKFDSFAIISTHSPLIIQEIPSSNVWIFERDGNLAETRPLDIESFGENLTTISNHIFETNEIQDNFKRSIKELALLKSYNEVLEMFNNKLSFNAKMYLSSQYITK